MGHLHCIWYTKASEIEPDIWNKLIRDERHIQSWYSALDQANLPDKTQFYYAVFYEQDKPVALVPTFLKSIPIDFVMPDFISSIIGFFDKYIYAFRFQRFFFIGSYVDYGVIGLNEHYHFEGLQSQIAHEIDLQSKRLGASVIVWKDFEKHVCDHLSPQKYFTLCSFPDVFSEIKGSNFDEFLQHKPYFLRKKMKRKLRQSHQNHCELFIIQEPNEKELALLYECFEHIWEKYATSKITFDHVNQDYFKSSSKDHHFIYIGLRDKVSQAIINVVQCLQTHDSLFQVFYGFNTKKFSPNNGHYFLLQKKVIEYCIENHIKHLFDGQNQYTAKLDMGSQLLPYYNAVKSHSVMMQWLIKQLKNNLTWSNLSPELATYLKAHPEALPQKPHKPKWYHYLRTFIHALPPTAGYRIYGKDFWNNRHRLKDSKATLEQNCAQQLGVPYVHFTNSGTAALYLLLKSISHLTASRTIIIPAYTCPLVVFAIVRAGFKVQLCDSNGIDFNFDLEQLSQLCNSNEDIAAVLVTHLGGIPAQIEKVSAMIQRAPKPIFLIEDAAQAFGAIAGNQPVGSWGDFAIFSFAAGKGATFYEGGLLASKHHRFKEVLQKTINTHEHPNPFLECWRVIQLLGYWLLYRPCLFFWIYTLPQSIWAHQNNWIRALNEEFSIDFPIHKVSNLRAYLGFANFLRMPKEIEAQRQKASCYLDALASCNAIRVLREEAAQDKATYPFLSLILSVPRKVVFPNLLLQASGVSLMFAQILPDYAYLRPYLSDKSAESYPNADKLCKGLVTLSTTAFITNKEITEVSQYIKTLLNHSQDGA
ncbi:cell wall biosynthesis regulatory pyridoxal phosphate-dependent protein [Legionella cherrii]|uniref:Cell wall biosynthesis regulatory pyridoxal phosphate-dependent protein n=1 Tax=Legionella cherrii TaxID=28084 RepID=A0A0W0S8J3_9GAMM|nr:DegT/DnrJ/EryC1/StrS family aminotransferase [Legionella cherrii]KTC79811.1 cell wall biosynthesis regulatory pyridoxal phosphate-dependent protein [Legionella cherrii]